MRFLTRLVVRFIPAIVEGLFLHKNLAPSRNPLMPPGSSVEDSVDLEIAFADLYPVANFYF
jgi:hypothetical protein